MAGKCFASRIGVECDGRVAVGVEPPGCGLLPGAGDEPSKDGWGGAPLEREAVSASQNGRPFQRIGTRLDPYPRTVACPQRVPLAMSFH
jgi:hypothetical protein